MDSMSTEVCMMFLWKGGGAGVVVTSVVLDSSPSTLKGKTVKKLLKDESEHTF